jgi:hypothetical protein
MMKPHLIPNWRRAWRMFSVQAQALALAVIGGWQAMPDDLRTVVPPEAVFGLAMVLLVAGIVGRLIDQPKVRE